MVKIEIANESWVPDRSSRIPLFKQIYDFIIAKISSGQWSIGSKLPTQLELAKAFKVNRSTILEVYDELKAEGFVKSQKSSGTIIVNNTWSLLTAQAPLDWSKKIAESIHKPNLDIIKIINDTESDKDFIRLGAGELARDISPSKYLKEIFRELSNEIEYMGYEEPRGLLILRQEIAKYLRKKGIETDGRNILIVSGALQALNLISTGLLHRGSAILTEKPSYLQSLTLFDSHRINLSGIEMDNEGIRLDLLIKNCVAKKPELLYTIPNYHNPSGILMSEKRRKELLAICERERLAIIEDDVYGELWFEEQPPRPIKADDKNGTVLYIGSISKTLSAGMRIGWVVGNENVIDRLADIKMQTDYGSSNISQWMCYEFLKSGRYEGYIGELRSVLKRKREFTISILETYFSDIAIWNIPKGGLYIWLTIKKDLGTYRLFERCYGQKIIINPGQLYEQGNHKSLRISYAYASAEELEAGLMKLNKIIRELWGQS